MTQQNMIPSKNCGVLHTTIRTPRVDWCKMGFQQPTKLAKQNGSSDMIIFTHDGVDRPEITDFGQAVIDAMNAHVAVVNRNGDIILVNKAWQGFMQESCDGCIDHLGVGANYWHYLSACVQKSCAASLIKTKILAAIQALLKGEENHFTLEYPCQGPLGEHWFMLSVTPLGSEPMGVVISHLDITARHQSEQALEDLNQQLRRLSARLEKVLEEERARIARELHDELGQRLMALRMELLWVDSRLAEDKPSIKEKVQELIELVDSTTHSVRRIANDLRPMMLDDLGVIAAIEWLTEDFSKHTGIPCLLTVENVDLNGDDAIATALFRLVQESLTNAARHAQATRVKVTIRQSNGALLVQVSDNGKGFSERKIPALNSLGLVGMQERARMLGGRVSITSHPGVGTEVLITLPMSAPTDEGASPCL